MSLNVIKKRELDLQNLERINFRLNLNNKIKQWLLLTEEETHTFVIQKQDNKHYKVLDINKENFIFKVTGRFGNDYVFQRSPVIKKLLNIFRDMFPTYYMARLWSKQILLQDEQFYIIPGQEYVINLHLTGVYTMFEMIDPQIYILSKSILSPN
jgi:hypothetical protein